MNLYLLTRSDAADYDEFDSFVACARSEDEARAIHPRGGIVTHTRGPFDSWVSMGEVKAQLIGKAAKGIEPGVICASFNAG